MDRTDHHRRTSSLSCRECDTHPRQSRRHVAGAAPPHRSATRQCKADRQRRHIHPGRPSAAREFIDALPRAGLDEIFTVYGVVLGESGRAPTSRASARPVCRSRTADDIAGTQSDPGGPIQGRAGHDVFRAERRGPESTADVRRDHADVLRVAPDRQCDARRDPGATSTSTFTPSRRTMTASNSGRSLLSDFCCTTTADYRIKIRSPNNRDIRLYRNATFAVSWTHEHLYFAGVIQFRCPNPPSGTNWPWRTWLASTLTQWDLSRRSRRSASCLDALPSFRIALKAAQVGLANADGAASSPGMQ